MKNSNISPSSHRSFTQARGRARRAQLLQAAAGLLRKKELEEISFNEIAQHAKIPKGSAYHFYTNVMDLYAALTEQFGADLIAHLSPTIKIKKAECWKDIFAASCRRVEEFYDHRPDARQLLIGGKTPPQLKRSDRENDRRIGAVLKGHFEKYFELPSLPNEPDVFFYAVEIVDLMYCLSMIRHNRITEEMGQEAIRAGVAYLSLYLPDILPRH